MVAGGLGYLQYDYFIPILGLRLVELGCTEEQVGLIFCICSGVYILGSVITAHISSSFPKKATIMIGLFTSFIAQLFCGPSSIFGLPGDSILLMCIGQAMVGITLALVIIPGLPEIIEEIERKYPKLSANEKTKVSDISSGVINCAYGIG